MKALLLAAGLGTRLRPITDHTPKCLVPINGKPLLEIWLERLSSAGFGPFLINTHYLHEKVESFIKKSPYKSQCSLIYEPKLLGTAATVLRNIDFFEGEDGLILHADNFCHVDFRSFLDMHMDRPVNCSLTMMTFVTPNPELCGIVELDHQGVVNDFHEKKITSHGNLANAALYIASKEFFNEIKNNYKDAVDFSMDILPCFLNRIYTYHHNDYFLDIGTLNNYQKAVKYALRFNT